MFGESPREAKLAKQQFLHGNGKIMNHCELGDPQVTMYMKNYKG